MSASTVKAVDTRRLAPARHLRIDGVRYAMGHQVGIGAFSRVYRARDEWDNPLVVKVYPPGMRSALWQNEVRQLRRFAGPAVVWLHRVFQHEGHTYLVLDDAGVPISRCTFGQESHRMGAALLVARSILQALERIHRGGHFHGDINPQNVLVRLDDRQQLAAVSLVDFSLCRPQSALRRGPVDMASWSPPPEYWRKTPMAGPAIDVWHVGVLLLELIKGVPLAFSRDEVCEGRLVDEALAMPTPAGRALAAALASAPADRPDAMTLWRALSAAAAQVRP